MPQTAQRSARPAAISSFWLQTHQTPAHPRVVRGSSHHRWSLRSPLSPQSCIDSDRSSNALSPLQAPLTSTEDILPSRQNQVSATSMDVRILAPTQIEHHPRLCSTTQAIRRLPQDIRNLPSAMRGEARGLRRCNRLASGTAARKREEEQSAMATTPDRKEAGCSLQFENYFRRVNSE